MIRKLMGVSQVFNVKLPHKHAEAYSDSTINIFRFKHIQIKTSLYARRNISNNKRIRKIFSYSISY